MPTNWNEVNDRRIGEKTLELRNYCSQRRICMTQRAFDLARISLSQLLDNIRDRDEAYGGIPDSVKRSMDNQDIVVAECSEMQANALARTIVYKCIGDDLNLYPVTAKQKIRTSQARGFKECNIPKDEMTFNDILFVARAIAMQVNISRNTMVAVFQELRQYGLDPYMARVYGYYSFNSRPEAITSLPGQANFGSEYKKAARKLMEMGYLQVLDDGKYQVSAKELAK